jgi:hypothetical protein
MGIRSCQITGDRDAARKRLSRLTEVLREYLTYDSDYQLALVDKAIDWAVVSLARSEDRSQVEAGFYRLVDAMYASTGHAASCFDDNEREALYSQSMAARERLSPDEVRIAKISAEKLEALDRKRPDRIVFGMLSLPRLASNMEFANVTYLRELVQGCVSLCLAIETYDLGGTSAEELFQVEIDVGNTAKKVMESLVVAMRQRKSEHR